MIPKCGCLLLLVVVSMTALCQANDTCFERTDILFVLDASSSVGSDNFQKQLQFAATFASNFVIGQARFSVIRFAGTASFIFDFNAYNDVTALQNAILSISYTTGGTDTAAALRLVRTAGFSSTSGARPGVAKIVVVCTDGQSNTPSDTAVEANNLKNSNVLVLSIGVGSGVNQAELKTIASFPEDVFVVIDYNQLLSIVYDYSQLVCAAVKLFKCNSQADVYFLLDTSNNIGQDAYQKELQYVGEFGTNFDLKDVSIGAATFGGSATRAAFKLGQFTTPNQLAQGLSSAVKLGGVTDTDSALRYVTAQKVFDAASGGRDNATNIVIILTEGNSRTASQAETTALQLRSSGVNIIAVGVSTPNIAELKTLVGHDVLDVVGSLSMPKVLVDRVLTLTALRECKVPKIPVKNATTCLSGFEIDPNNQSTCRDINECMKYTLCQQTCVNLNGSYRCECKAGFVISTTDTSKCDDINECKTNNPCQQTCVNLPGSVRCECTAGYVINTKDTTKCDDINECKTSNPCQHICVNLDGSFRCSCKAGYVVNTTDTTKCDSLRSCTGLVDIIFLVDASGNIGARNFTLQQRFAAKLTHQFIVGRKGAQIAGVLFAKEVKELFKLNTYTSRTDITSDLLGASYSQGATNTHRGINYILDNNLFSSASGGRSNARDVVIVVTHEVSARPDEILKTDNYTLTCPTLSAAKQAAAKLKQQGATVVAVGVGSNVDNNELTAIASSSDDLFLVSGFNSLDSILQRVTDRMCPKKGP